MARRHTIQTTLGLTLFSYLTAPVITQSQPTICYYTVADPQNPTNPIQDQKSCYNGCCSTTRTDPCCQIYQDDSSLSGGAIGGIIIGVIIFFILIGAGLFIYFRRSKMKDKKQNYATQQKPAVSYIANSEISDTTDYKRENLGYATSVSSHGRSRDTNLAYLPPIARQEDDSDLETASNKISYKSEPFSAKSEPHNFPRRPKPYAGSVSSVESRSDKYSVTSDPMPESRGRPRDLPIRDQSPRARSRQSRNHSERSYRDYSPSDGHRRDHSPYNRHQPDRSPSEHDERSQRDHSPRGRRPRDQSPRQARSNSRPRQQTTSTSSIDSRNNRSRQQRHRDNTHSTSSVTSRDRNKSVSESMASDAGSIGTTV